MKAVLLRKSLRRRVRRGFTLVELLVASVAGLLVALGVLALARDATVNFQDQLRVSQNEMTLRVASQRLTNDLARASYMSTSHLALDPIAGRLGIRPEIYNPDVVLGLNQLGSVKITQAAADGDNPLLNQDTIVLGGNFTTTDEYQASVDDTATAGGGCAGPALWLGSEAVDAGVMRLLAGAANDADRTTLVQRAFLPGGANAIVRVTNALGDGREWYVVACAAGYDATRTPHVPFVRLTRALPSNFKTPIINPVQLVRWQVQDVTTLPAALGSALGAGDGGAGKPHYALTRAYLNVADLTAIDSTVEAVADHVVDLAFGVSVLDISGASPVFTTYTFGDTNVASWAGTISAAPSGGAAATNGYPHRIRSIQYRLSVRAALTDRDTALTTSGFPVRYYDAPNRYARLRTFAGEVTLANQASDTFHLP